MCYFVFSCHVFVSQDVSTGDSSVIWCVKWCVCCEVGAIVSKVVSYELPAYVIQ